MNRMEKAVVVVVCCMMVVGSVMLVKGKTAEAGSKIVPVEGAMYEVGSPMSQNIVMFMNKRITVLLSNGQTLTGKVSGINNIHLHLSELSGEDFFDALVNTGSIIAIKTQFRIYK